VKIKELLGQSKAESEADIRKCRSYVKRLVGYISQLEGEKGKSDKFSKIYATLKHINDSLLKQKQSPFE
jgi:hypothetical protein